MCSRELRRKLGAWDTSGVKGTMAKLSADGASAPEDSASAIDSGPLLLPANGEAASGTSARGEDATCRGVPKPSAVEIGAGCSRANAADGVSGRACRACLLRLSPFAPLAAYGWTASSSRAKLSSRSSVEVYLPITLLNSDYKLLAKALATRFGPALQHVLDPIQTAFVPGLSFKPIKQTSKKLNVADGDKHNEAHPKKPGHSHLAGVVETS